MIDRFEGQYDFLSNFYPSPFVWKERTYPTVEHFFQAHKAKTQEDFEFIMRQSTPSGSKWAGRQVELRSDWEDIKDTVMMTALRLKFTQNPELKEKLLATGNEQLIEGTTWHDQYWGICTCPRCGGKGKNHLGILLMKLREELRNDT